MKRPVYDLTDDEFATLLVRTHDCFSNAGIPYMFVGGVAIQAHNAFYLTNSHRKPLKELTKDPSFRVQDFFRATDDVDITLKKGSECSDIDFAKRILGVLAEISEEHDYLSPTDSHVITIVPYRTGVARPIFNLGKDVKSGERLDPERVVSFNIYQGPKPIGDKVSSDFEGVHYDEFLERAVICEIPYGNTSKLVLRVKKPEDLLATKIVRGRDKDWTDILSLYRNSQQSGNPIDLGVVESLLCSPHSKYQVPDMALVDRYERFRKFIDS